MSAETPFSAKVQTQVPLDRKASVVRSSVDETSDLVLEEALQVLKVDTFEVSVGAANKLSVYLRHGSIKFQGATGSRARVVVRKKIFFGNESEKADAEKALSQLSFQLKAHDRILEGTDRFELPPQKNKSSLDALLKMRSKWSYEMDVEIRLPPPLALSVSLPKGKLQISEMSGDMDLRMMNGEVFLKDIEPSSLILNCGTCSLIGTGIRSDKMRILSKVLNGKIDNIRFSQASVDVRSGQFYFEKVFGKIKGSAGDAFFHFRRAEGGIEWTSKAGGLQVDQMTGPFMVKTAAGKVSLEVLNQSPEDDRWIETESGSTLLTLPFSFTGSLDLWSMQGKLSMQFPWDREERDVGLKDTYGPAAPNRIVGRVGNGGTLLRIFSISGDIRVLKGK